MAKLTPEERRELQRSGVEAAKRKRSEDQKRMIEAVLRDRREWGIISQPPPEVQGLIDGIKRRLDRIAAHEALAAGLFCKYDRPAAIVVSDQTPPRRPPGRAGRFTATEAVNRF
jgi:hypothetical protein